MRYGTIVIVKHQTIAMILALIAAAVAGPGCAAPEMPIKIEWTEGPPLPSPLGGHVAAVLANRIVVVGGTNWIDGKKYWRDQMWMLDEQNARWREAGKLPAGLALFANGVLDDSLLILGGWTEHGPTTETYRYANDSVTPSKSMDLPHPRALAGGGTANGSIYVIGGMTDPVDFKTATTSVISLKSDDAKARWTEVAPLPRPLGLATTVSLAGKIFVFGGMGPVANSAVDSTDAFRYDPSNNLWTKLAPLPGPRRGSAGVAIDDHHILIVGGCHGDKDGPVMLDEVLLYDTFTNRYHPATPLPFKALCEQAVIKGNQIYIIGGEDLPRHRTDRVIVGRIASRDQ
jgi:N-acetylneuraminic acid mutarotase